ncbi:hypothetical protein PoB_002099600 [Plakobranchus ocellatus]|uniref:Uncharacterized protein n=1 Tax=Plakobranchus ocellatus TaxID=259542 RepID=A0AAV3Z5A8_9GAST|nr:hypothetical protein PoB_002099600 [Plakobranchus ocellatus]
MISSFCFLPSLPPTIRVLCPCIRAGKAFTHETFTGASGTAGTAWWPATLARASLSWTGPRTTMDGRLSMYPSTTTRLAHSVYLPLLPPPPYPSLLYPPLPSPQTHKIVGRETSA